MGERCEGRAPIIYDFACGAHRAALCRVPTIASTVNECIDISHYRQGHNACSCARCSSAYQSLRGANTSSSEQRNAATVRLKPFLRLLNQKNFLTFSSLLLYCILYSTPVRQPSLRATPQAHTGLGGQARAALPAARRVPWRECGRRADARGACLITVAATVPSLSGTGRFYVQNSEGQQRGGHKGGQV